MMIVAIAWIYVVGLMAIAETSIVAGIMTFLFYCVLPLTIILYLMDAPRRRQKIARAAEQQQAQNNFNPHPAETPPEDDSKPDSTLTK